MEKNNKGQKNGSPSFHAPFFSFLISFAVFCEYKYKPSSLCVFICACEWTMWVGKKTKIEQCEHMRSGEVNMCAVLISDKFDGCVFESKSLIWNQYYFFLLKELVYLKYK